VGGEGSSEALKHPPQVGGGGPGGGGVVVGGAVTSKRDLLTFHIEGPPLSETPFEGTLSLGKNSFIKRMLPFVSGETSPVF